MSKIPGTEEIRTFPRPDNIPVSEESKKVSWFGSYQATNVIILIFIIIAAAGIITGSISLSEKTEQKTIRSVSSADFVTGPQHSGTNVTQQSDGKYVVTLDYTRPVSGGGYINYLYSIVAGSAEPNKALVLDGVKGISGITSLTSTNIFGKIGSDTSQSDGYFSDVVINGGLSVTSKSFLEGGLSVTGGLSVAGGSYLDGVLVSGDTSTNSASGASSAIIGGDNNIINATDSTNCGIFAGNNNQIIDTTQGRSVVLGGQTNSIAGTASYHSVIAGGQGSSIAGTASRNSGIIGGYQNKIEGTRSYQSFIAGGSENIISGTSSNDSGIIGGNINKINSQFTFIGGGEGLSTQGGSSWNYTALVGRYNNYTTYPWDGDAPDSSGTCYRFIVGSGTGSNPGDGKNAFSVDDKGNLYFGTSAGASIYYKTSSTGYTAKSFTIQHPTVPNRWLRHGCLEGPEGGVYYRGKGEAPATIRLPDYATHIASDFTVQVTPIGSPRMMSASEVSQEGTFRVYGEGKFHWTAIGERVPLEAEPLKTEVNIHSMGPYSWSV